MVRERFDSGIRSAEDLEAQVELPILARVPRRRGAESESAFTEAFRVLRTNLQFAGGADGLRSIAVTSGHAGEGKSTTVTHLALAAASAGQQVVVVEADVKRPSQGAVFGLGAHGRAHPGLTNFIVGGATLDECLQPVRGGAISVITAGPQVPSLSGLLESARGTEVLDELAGAGDLTIFDCPPLGVGADAAAVAGRVGGVVLVVDLGAATRESVRESLRLLQGVRANVLGVVVNRDPGVGDAAYEYGVPPRPTGRAALTR